MRITAEILADWTSSEGYSDFNGENKDYRLEVWFYDGALVVANYYNDTAPRVAMSAKFGGHRGKLRLTPEFLSLEEGYALLKKCSNPPMPDPEFSLDEIALGEEMIRG